VIQLRKVVRSRSILFLAAVSAVASWLAAQTAQPTKTATARVKPGEVHFEDIASQAGLNALNIYGGDAHKEFIIETTGTGSSFSITITKAGPTFFSPTVTASETLSRKRPSYFPDCVVNHYLVSCERLILINRSLRNDLLNP